MMYVVLCSTGHFCREERGGGVRVVSLLFSLSISKRRMSALFFFFMSPKANASVT